MYDPKGYVVRAGPLVVGAYDNWGAQHVKKLGEYVVCLGLCVPRDGCVNVALRDEQQ